MIAEIIPCFPSFAAVRAAGSSSEVFVEFVELETVGLVFSFLVD